jgi:hypothetical protein
VALALALLLGGCVYYNGMYNAKQLAGNARKAERDGRAFEANNLWGQVVTRAESLVARHPESKYVDEALVLKGLALSRLRQCQEAVAPLGRVSQLPADAEVAEEGWLALGRCHLELGDATLAEIEFARVTESADAVRRLEARLLRGRALRLTGRPDDALTALEGIAGPRAGQERMLALAAAHRRDAALALADSLLSIRDTTARWDTLVATLGAVEPHVASALVDRLAERPGTPATSRARMLYEDGIRLSAVDTARARSRLREVAGLPEPPEYAERARVALARQRIARASAPSELRPIAPDLEARVASRTVASAEAATLRDLVAFVLAAVDSAEAGAAQADLRLFLAAETARDSLAAPALAASLFRTIVESSPDSPYAPKAILAGHALDPRWGESAFPLLEDRYALSPYVARARGEEGYGYRELEDSLRTFTLGLAAARRGPPQRPMLREDSLAGRRGPAPRPRRGLEP